MIIFRPTRALSLGKLTLRSTRRSSYASGSTIFCKLPPKNVTYNQVSTLCRASCRPTTSATIYNHQSWRPSSNSSKTIQPFILPDIGEGIKEVTVKGWLIKLGDSVKEFDEICEVESDKATATITSRYEGTIRKIYHETGAIAMVGEPLVDIEVAGKSDSTPLIEKQDTQQRDQGSGSDVEMGRKDTSRGSLALPSVRRLAHENGLELDAVVGTGKNGLILKEDVLAYLETKAKTADSTATSNHSNNAPIHISNQGRETIIPLQGIRRAMFKNMTKSLSVPHFNYSDEIDLTHLVNITKAMKLADKRAESGEKKVGQLPFIIKMISLALLEYPQLNGVVDESGSQLVQKNYHNIGVAVDTKAGLIVPNIKNVQSLSIEQINSELSRLRELAYQSKLSTGDLSGGTVTLSNIGAIGGVFGVPVLMHPEIVIGALGRIRPLPRFNSSGELEKRQIVQIVWSADHRVVDGASLSRFCNLFKQFLENPEHALLRLV